MIKNGYPDPESLADGDDPKKGDSAVYVPGTKIIEPRRHPGFKGMSRSHLIGCLDKFNYIKKADLFNKSSGIRTPRLEFNKINPLVSLTPLTRNPFMVSPYYEDTVRVKLSFDAGGNSRFINEFGHTSETTIAVLPQLNNTVLEGYLYPHRGQDFIFYPIDNFMVNGRDISGLDYYSRAQCRWGSLREAVNIIKATDPELNIEMRFDLNIVQGPGYFLREDNVSGLLFISYTGSFYLWSNIQYTPKTINLYFKVLPSGRWEVSLDGVIPETLLPQNKGVFLRTAFTKDKPREFLLECELNINQTDNSINTIEPVIPKSILTGPIYTREEVLGTLKSVKSPLSEDIFTNLNMDPLGFKFHENIYVYNGHGQPLTITAVE
jgi:hypothetical protein